MSSYNFTRLIASVNTDSSLMSDVDLSVLIEKMAAAKTAAILSAKDMNVEFAKMVEANKVALRQIENADVRNVVELLSTTLFINHTAIEPDILYTGLWFSLYNSMQLMVLEEDTMPFIIENLDNLQSLLRWALDKWVAKLIDECNSTEYDSADFKVYELTAIASMLQMYHELRVNYPDEFNVSFEEARTLFTKTIFQLIQKCNLNTIFYFHTHEIFTHQDFIKP